MHSHVGLNGIFTHVVNSPSHLVFKHGSCLIFLINFDFKISREKVKGKFE